MNDPYSSFGLRLGGVAPTTLAHRLESWADRRMLHGVFVAWYTSLAWIRFQEDNWNEERFGLNSEDEEPDEKRFGDTAETPSRNTEPSGFFGVSA